MFHKINEQYLLLPFQTYFYVFTNQYKKIDKYSVLFISVAQSCQFFVIPLTKACQLPFVVEGTEFFQKERKRVCCVTVWCPLLCVSCHGEVWDKAAACEVSSAWVFLKILLFKWVLKCEREKGLSP